MLGYSTPFSKTIVYHGHPEVCVFVHKCKGQHMVKQGKPGQSNGSLVGSETLTKVF